MVIHHFRSMAEACRELFRVLRPGGIVLVRNAVKDRLDSVLFYSFFPSAKVADEARMPEMKDVVGAFERAGLDAIAHEIIIQQDDESLRLHLERIKLRALSSLMLISDEEFHNGVEAMERAAAAETAPRPVTVPIDLLVFRRRDKGRELPSG
jgi:SAM-dependent methyltransferase